MGLRVDWLAIVAGVLSFAVAYLFDWATLRGTGGLKRLTGVAVSMLQGIAVVTAIWGVERFSFPAPVVALGAVLLAGSSALFIYSFFIEIPFSKTYAESGSADTLITTGSYALVRHPGVLWYALLLLALFLTTGSHTLLVALPIWTFLDVIYVVLQERYVFVRQFSTYRDYQQQTPMLVPTCSSIAKCFKTLRPKEVRHD